MVVMVVMVVVFGIKIVKPKSCLSPQMLERVQRGAEGWRQEGVRQLNEASEIFEQTGLARQIPYQKIGVSSRVLRELPVLSK